MKKIVLMLLSVVMVASLASCGDNCPDRRYGQSQQHGLFA